MSHEIELKAWVDDCESVSAMLSAIATFEFEYVKADEYWFPIESGARVGVIPSGTLPTSGLRVRKEKQIDADDNETNVVLVTYKTKEMRDQIEINDEHEFALAAPEHSSMNVALSNFEELLGKLNLQRSYTKKKQGFSYKCEKITVELSLVEKLGWFLELEILSEDDAPQTISAARESLLAFLAKAGIPETKIETQYYSELLQQLPT
ncbi:MAG: CYTH domain-containing protein [Spirochaetaceae bacterium]|jgi:adenylate cyclase class 2|nr:CYTH domain-containing protein [Spirochaetaceae bacterium]